MIVNLEENDVLAILSRFDGQSLDEDTYELCMELYNNLSPESQQKLNFNISKIENEND